MITKKFGVDFHSTGGALTLDPSEVSGGFHTYGAKIKKTHEDGWTITGAVTEDYYEWVNEFSAIHPTFGKVWGDFELEVYADTEEGFDNFYNNHTPTACDYHDI